MLEDIPATPICRAQASVSPSPSPSVNTTAELVSVDGKQSQLYVKGLSTPIGTYPSARIRTSDIAQVQVCLPAAQTWAALHHTTAWRRRKQERW